MTPTTPAPFTTLAVDTHAHVFHRDLPMEAGRRYTPGYDAELSAYLAHLDRAGLSHGVLVQPSFLGVDNSYLIDALRTAPARLRGVAVVSPDTSVVALREMDRAGIVGIRLNLFGREVPDFKSGTWPVLLAAVNDLGWHVEVHQHAAELPHVLAPLRAAGCRVVVDHFGRPDPRQGVDDPGFAYLLTQAASGHVWVKLSAAYRNWTGADALAQSAHAARLLLGAFGAERLVWGSDWPHTEHREVTDFDTCRQQLDDWITPAAERRAILGATAAHLFKI
ncbi:amidohydrolase family protein [Alcaligenaceae bacterium A4P071]|nr:amidohydrolase family protein [Alcaligenaceae bacterium A4P071]